MTHLEFSCPLAVAEPADLLLGFSFAFHLGDEFFDEFKETFSIMSAE